MAAVKATRDPRRAFCKNAGDYLLRACEEEGEAPQAAHPVLQLFQTQDWGSAGSDEDPKGLRMARADLAKYVSAVYFASTYDSQVIAAHFVLVRRLLTKLEAPLTPSLLYKLVPTSLQVAAKCHSDFFYQNKCMAKLASIPLAEMNEMERAFLVAIDFDARCSPEDYDVANEALAAAQGVRCAEKAAEKTTSVLVPSPPMGAQQVPPRPPQSPPRCARGLGMAGRLASHRARNP
eukprot:Rhum_TRINITY_DN18717_c0_g1::Rhum_TRINITY_DN18717_c0_g1_i1::g.168202::m.168202